MGSHLVVSIRLHGDGQGTARFHGASRGSLEWPPAPARLFQALVAGVARGRMLPLHIVPALKWLEALPPPMIAAPRRWLGQAIDLWVPNNDADALPDPLDVSDIRVKKPVQPSLFAEDEAFVYAWRLPAESRHAADIAAAADEIYQFGRSVDMAWAVGEVLSDEALSMRLDDYPGVVRTPDTAGNEGNELDCPTAGSLDSLRERHRAVTLRPELEGKRALAVFANAPKPYFRGVSYEATRRRSVFELRNRNDDQPSPWALVRVSHLVELLRDGAADRLLKAFPERRPDIERTIVGRDADGSGAVPIAGRVRIVPLPSIGFEHADRAIRRFLLDVPSGTSLRADDIEWAFSGLEQVDPDTGELSPMVVTRSDADPMLRHYRGPSRCWRSVTAVALPRAAGRRRIEPARRREEAKSASERLAEESRAVAAVGAALRHAGIRETAVAVRVQREPFEPKCGRAEDFAEGTRFAKERMWHVEVELDRVVEGPLVIGDGRYLGLGVLAPVAELPDRSGAKATPSVRPSGSGGAGMFAWAVEGVVQDEPVVLARALRRAVMARVQAVSDGPLDRYFTGHESAGGRSTAQGASHLAFHWDGPRRLLLVIAPHRLDRRAADWTERRKLRLLERALEAMVELRAGPAGRFALRRVSIDDPDVLTAVSRSWTSVTPYVATRHRKHSTAHETLIADVLAECERRNLPRPRVTVLEARGVAGSGLQGRIRLDFSVAISGPVALGRTHLLGGGLFAASQHQ